MLAKSTAQRIAVAARRLLDKEGMEAVTMRRVAGAVGVTPMAVYRHYPNRNGLLNALADQGFSDLAARLEKTRSSGGIEARLTRMLEVFLDHALENPRLFELMFLKPRAGARRYPKDFKSGDSPTANQLVNVVREGIESGHFRQDDEWEVGFAIGALSHGLIMLYLGGRTNMTVSRFRAYYGQSFRRYLDGIRKQPQPCK